MSFRRNFATRAQVIARWSCLVLLAPLLVGCAQLVPEDSDAWRESQRSVLQKRAETRWAAIIAEDFAAAYEFQTPGYRAVASLQQYRGSFGQAVSWRMARLQNVQYDSSTSAIVSVSVAYRAGVRGSTYSGEKVIAEQWLYAEGKWWYVAAK